MLELRAHEPIPISRILQNQKMNLEHGHVEHQRHNDQTDRPRHKMPHKQSRRHLQIAEQIPQLHEGAAANGGDGEEADPFAADHGAEGEPGEREPGPPGRREGLVPVLVTEAAPEEDGEGGEKDEWGVEEDVP